MSEVAWEISRGDDPILVTAIHAGHELRTDVSDLLKLADDDRLREEDPYTDRWTDIAENSIRVHTSRFEVDLNRPRERSVYRVVADAWGLDLWRSEPEQAMIDASLDRYDDFYRELGACCDDIATHAPRFVVLDLHSYNHRRGGPDAQADDPEANPEINVGTGSIDRASWSDVVDAFSGAMAGVEFDGGHLDVRENVKFTGGHMSQWLNARYGAKGCAIAVEMKKFFMDEWTGEPDESVVAELRSALAGAAEAVRSCLR